MERNNAALAAVVENFPTITLMDAYTLLNNYPAATSDGRHWGAVGDLWQARPEIGVGEFALTDAMFHHWSQE